MRERDSLDRHRDQIGRAADLALLRAKARKTQEAAHPGHVYHTQGDVHVAVELALKGKPGTELRVTLGGTDRDPWLEQDRRTIVFVDASGAVDRDGVLPIHDSTWPDVLAAWGKATVVERAALLVDQIAAGGELADAAATALTEHPDVLAALGAAQIDRLTGLVARVHSTSLLPLALARIHARGLAAAIARRKLDYAFQAYMNGAGADDWTRAAEACRTGTSLKAS